MNEKKFDELKEDYEKVAIPEELDQVVRKALQTGKQSRKNRQWLHRVSAVAAGIVIFVGGINISPTMASVLAEVPGMKNLVQVLTFRDYQFDDGLHQANIEVPAITGLEESGLGDALNQKYLEENQALYEQFMIDVKEMEALGEGHLGVDSGYMIKTDNERLLSIGRYVVEMVGSSSTVIKYDTIDKVEQVLITLPSLFKDDQYVAVISDYIVDQMNQAMDKDPNMMYWVEREGQEEEMYFEPFRQISPEQSFFINPDYKLVISFDKYEVGPGVMGVQEFVIPTEVIADLLVSNEYIKP
ncbi:MAG: DUF3298 domain-containing protein [Desulfitobacterium sp.]